MLIFLTSGVLEGLSAITAGGFTSGVQWYCLSKLFCMVILTSKPIFGFTGSELV